MRFRGAHDQEIWVQILQLIPKNVIRRMIVALLLNSVEAVVALMALLSGLPILINPDQLTPGSVIALLPIWGVYAWAVMITIGGFATAIGIIFQLVDLERIGVLALGSTTTVFAIALIPFLPRAWVAMVTFILFSLAMGARWAVLGKSFDFVQWAMVPSKSPSDER